MKSALLSRRDGDFLVVEWLRSEELTNSTRRAANGGITNGLLNVDEDGQPGGCAGAPLVTSSASRIEGPPSCST